MNIFIHIKNNLPLVFSEITEFIQNKYSNYNDLDKIPSYICVGILLDYLNENAIEMSLSDISIQTLDDEILTALTIFEQTIKHYS